MLSYFCHLLPRKELKMKNKHMTLEMRERIEKGIRNNEKLSDIAFAIDKDPTTISKEVLAHRIMCDVTPLFNAALPCSKCVNMSKCKLRKVCEKPNCSYECRHCKRFDPTTRCGSFVLVICKRTKRFPYVCNGCSKRSRCHLQKYEYMPLQAHKGYEKLLKESRQGFNLTVEEYNHIDKVLKEGTEKGQSINHILGYADLNISLKTGYNYVNSGRFSIKKDDLPNYLNNIIKKRKVISKDYDYLENKDMNRLGREYYDYILYVDNNNIVYHGELDCVGITKDYVGALLTVVIPKWSFLLLYKLEVKDMEHVVQCINFIYEAMGYDKFNHYLGILLTDRGPEFNDYQGIEIDKEGIRRTKLFYCDSGMSTQKPFVERINREIRRYVFKGQSVAHLTQEDCDIIASNINNMTIASLGNKTPYDIAKVMLGEVVLKRLNIKYIKPEDLLVKNIDMIKHELKKKSK